jgi:alkanesulfonate monooxygenase SsuD/methylene tetrahydromethanopterin reductase-like flavin-dependent oxidoreductase (luciferase family)
MDPFVALTAATIATSTLKVGSGVCLLNQRDPIQTAKLVASIDQVSGGRFLFGVDIGWNAAEMENHGTTFAAHAQLVRDRIEAMKAIWTQPGAEYHGALVDSSRSSPGRSWYRSHTRRSSWAAGSRTRRAGPFAMAMA